MIPESSSSCGSQSMVSSLLRVVGHEFQGYLLPPILGTLLLEIRGQTCGCSLFYPVYWGPSRDVNFFRISFFQESFIVVDLSSSSYSFIGIHISSLPSYQGRFSIVAALPTTLSAAIAPSSSLPPFRQWDHDDLQYKLLHLMRHCPSLVFPLPNVAGHLFI